MAVMNGQRAKNFGDALERARRRAGLTQSQLATAASVPQSTLSLWERGLGEPSWDAVASLEDALDLTKGAMSRIFGYVPIGEGAPSVETAIMADTELDGYQRQLLITIYDSMKSFPASTPGLAPDLP